MTGRNRMLALALAAATIGACKDDDDGRDDELARQVATCSQALEAATDESGREAVRVLARGCPYACDGLSGWANAGAPDEALTALVEGCALACDEDAAKALAGASPIERYSTLVEHCGASYYHLPTPEGRLLSDVWFVLDRIGRWLHGAANETSAHAETQTALERATQRAHFPLPLPAQLEQVYRLPDTAAAEPATSALYLIATEDAVRGAAVPIARLRGPRIELRPVPGGAFPGQPLPPERVATAYTEIVDSFRELHRGQDVDEAPLVLADAGLPAERLLDVATAVGVPTFRLAVAGHGAWGHPVVFERLTVRQSAAPVVEVRKTELVVPGDEGDLHIPRADTDRLRSEVDHYAAMQAPLAKIELRFHPQATVADLIPLLDALEAARIEAVLFQPKTDDP